MNFLDFIFDNIFIVAIVVFAIFNLLSGSSKKKQSNEEGNTTGRFDSMAERFEDKLEEFGKKLEDGFDDSSKSSSDTESTTNRRPESFNKKPYPEREHQKESYEEKEFTKRPYKEREFKKEPIQQTSYEAQRQEQFDRLKQDVRSEAENYSKEVQKYEHKTKISDASGKLSAQKSNNHDKKTKVSPINIEKKLTSRGLIDSVIMSEVLGPPRAVKPFKNVAAQREENR